MKKIVIDENFKIGYSAEGRDYLKKIESIIKKTKNRRLKKVLKILNDDLGDVLTGPPEKLRRINKDILDLYPKRKLPKKDIDFFERIFSYTYLCSGNKKEMKYFDAYKLLETLDKRVCPYCDENFILFLDEGLIKDKKIRIRGPFDHYFPKALYPYFAVSLHNLVPSCHMCNSLKHDDDSYKNGVINPYEFHIRDNFHFDIDIKPLDINDSLSRSGVEINFLVHPGRIDKFPKKNIETFHNTFRLQKRYTNHKGLICRLWERVRLADNVLRPTFPGYDEQIFKEILFDTKSPEYQDSPLQELERDFSAKFFP